MRCRSFQIQLGAQEWQQNNYNIIVIGIVPVEYNDSFEQFNNSDKNDVTGWKIP